MRIYRSNPMDAVGRLPVARRALVVALLAAIALGAVGLWSELTLVARHGPEVRQAVAALGLGEAEVEAVRKAGCGRARRLYRWRTPSAQGTACAGSGLAVTLRVEAG